MHSDADIWSREIRDYLLGKFAKNQSTDILHTAYENDFAKAPIFLWWILEGKRYAGVKGPLLPNLDRLVAESKRLFQTFNPTVRLSERADGSVDWARTLSRGPQIFGLSQYVLQASAIGLNADERHALVGWVKWIEVQRCLYNGSSVDQFKPSRAELRRWAHVSRRSRWPILRNIVAATIRPLFEPEDIDKLPLPSDRAQLFEVLCFVRVARFFVPNPTIMTWLSAETDNSLQIGDAKIKLQVSLTRNAVLRSAQYQGALATSMRIFDVAPPSRADIGIEFASPKCGFSGIILEAKSGSQAFGDAIYQLKAYAAAWAPNKVSRYIIWGVIEQAVDLTREQIDRVRAESPTSEYLWLFSSADKISDALSWIFEPRVTENSST